MSCELCDLVIQNVAGSLVVVVIPPPRDWQQHRLPIGFHVVYMKPASLTVATVELALWLCFRIGVPQIAGISCLYLLCQV